MSAGAEFELKVTESSPLKQQLMMGDQVFCDVNIDPYDNRFCIVPTAAFASLSETQQASAIQVLEDRLFKSYAGKYFVDLTNIITNQVQVHSSFERAGFSFNLAEAGAGPDRVLQIRASALEAACTSILSSMYIETSDLRVLEGDGLRVSLAGDPIFVAGLREMMKKNGFDEKKVKSYLERPVESIFVGATPFCFVDRDNKPVAFCRFTQEGGGFYLSDTLGYGAAFMPQLNTQQQLLGFAVMAGVAALGVAAVGWEKTSFAIAVVDTMIIMAVQSFPHYAFSRVAMMKEVASRARREGADPVITCIAPLGGTLAMQYLLGFKTPEAGASVGARFIKATRELQNFPIPASGSAAALGPAGPFHGHAGGGSGVSATTGLPAAAP